MKWIDKEKLRHEWKTFVVQISGLLFGLHEAACQSGADFTPFLPEKYRPYALPIAMTLSLALRRYRNPK